MSAPSAKGLFLATKSKGDPGPKLFDYLPKAAPEHKRDALDYDPTPPDATATFLSREAHSIRAHGDTVWENAVGGGHLAGELVRAGFKVLGSDIVDRGWPGTLVRSFYEFEAAPARSIVTNPPYCEINARDGHGRWLRHALELGVPYIAFLLNCDWSAARINGLDALFAEHPPTVEYLCCWKIDFRGGGSPPQRNSWFVWDSKRPGIGPNRWLRERLYRDAPDARQDELIGERAENNAA